MYLEHFKLNELPFSLTPNPSFYCDLPTHKEALDTLLSGLQHDERMIKLIGEEGTGKTLLCRLLIDTLGDNFVTAYIPNPNQTGYDLHTSLSHELGLVVDNSSSEPLDIINMHLLELHKAGKQTVFIIDEAQALSDDGLKAVHLLENLKNPLHIVLVGQSELDKKLKQRIACSYRLKSLNKNESNLYISHRLTKAGYTEGMIFSTSAKKRLLRVSGGLPRILNVLCHKALLISFSRGMNQVDNQSMKRAIVDTESSLPKRLFSQGNVLLTLTTAFCLTAILIVYRKAGLL